MWRLLIILILVLMGTASGCADVGECAERAAEFAALCPLGTAPEVDAQAQAQCSAAIEGEYKPVEGEVAGSVSGACTASAECKFLCKPTPGRCTCGAISVSREQLVCAPDTGAGEVCGNNVCEPCERGSGSCDTDCRPEMCVPGAERCNPEDKRERQRCRRTGLGHEFVATCGAQQECRLGADQTTTACVDVTAVLAVSARTFTYRCTPVTLTVTNTGDGDGALGIADKPNWVHVRVNGVETETAVVPAQGTITVELTAVRGMLVAPYAAQTAFTIAGSTISLDVLPLGAEVRAPMFARWGPGVPVAGRGNIEVLPGRSVLVDKLCENTGLRITYDAPDVQCANNDQNSQCSVVALIDGADLAHGCQPNNLVQLIEAPAQRAAVRLAGVCQSVRASTPGSAVSVTIGAYVSNANSINMGIDHPEGETLSVREVP